MNDQAQTRRITIIGLGLIGGSIGLALKKAALPALDIIGQDQDRAAEKTAEKIGAIDRAEHDPRKAVEGAGLVIVATPITSLRDVFAEIAAHLAPNTIVSDTASTKGQVMKWAAELLPETVNFVGGHPMAGKEEHGIENADAGLFTGRAYCLCPTVECSEASIKSMMGLAGILGAEPMFIDPDEHDVYAAAVSHLPLVMSTALFNMLRESPSWDDLGMMASSGFRDMTRLASGDPGMSHAIWRTNREALIHWIDRMSSELNRIREMLNDAQDEALFTLFATAKLQRDEFLQNPPRRQPQATGVEVDRSRAFLEMMVGGMMADNIRRMQKLPEMMSEPQEIETPEGGKKKMSITERMGEDIKRDLEKLEREREERERRKSRE
jgi:prephenate dehydrogenase